MQHGSLYSVDATVAVTTPQIECDLNWGVKAYRIASNKPQKSLYLLYLHSPNVFSKEIEHSLFRQVHNRLIVWGGSKGYRYSL